MKYVSKDEIITKLQKLIDARKNKNCNRQSLVEKTAFEYCMAIVNSLEEKEIDE